jgi:hypothetical protein
VYLEIKKLKAKNSRWNIWEGEREMLAGADRCGFDTLVHDAVDTYLTQDGVAFSSNWYYTIFVVVLTHV